MIAQLAPTGGAFLGAFAGVIVARLASAWLVRRAFKAAASAMASGAVGSVLGGQGPPR